jgi:hypothetical protein
VRGFAIWRRPLATQRLAPVFLLPFEVRLEDSMLGQTLPPIVSIAARPDATAILTRGPDGRTRARDRAGIPELRLVLR